MTHTRLFVVLLAGAWLATAPAQAAKLLDFPSDERIKMLEYHANDIYTINTLYGYQTNIELEEGEEVQTISVGDRSLWQIVPSGSRLFIRPMDEDVSTNMTLITNLRAYQFDLKAGKGKVKDNPHLTYVAKFIYPKLVPYVPPPPPPPMPAPIETPGAMPTIPPQAIIPPPPPIPTPAPVISMPPSPTTNYLYSYSGKDDLAPVDTYDDGQSTYIRFANPAALPDVFTVSGDGSRTPVAYTLREGLMVLPMVRDRYALVYGKGKANEVYLYNESKNPTTVQP